MTNKKYRDIWEAICDDPKEAERMRKWAKEKRKKDKK